MKCFVIRMNTLKSNNVIRDSLINYLNGISMMKGLDLINQNEDKVYIRN